jgi:hypothetical protein
MSSFVSGATRYSILQASETKLMDQLVGDNGRPVRDLNCLTLSRRETKKAAPACLVRYVYNAHYSSSMSYSEGWRLLGCYAV